MIVRMWMNRELVTVTPSDPLGRAAALMATHRIRRLPVVEPGPGPARLAGILSHGDVLHAAPADVNPFAGSGPATLDLGVTVGQVMRTPVVTTDPDMPIEQVAELMRTHKFGALPVVEHDHLVGLVTESDIFRAFVSLFAVPGERARITFDVALGEDVFAVVSAIAHRRAVSVHGLMSSMLEGRPVFMLWVLGTGVDNVVQDLWAGGHVVLSIIRS